MSITQIKACQCARFPAGSAINASERINEKANIQIRKNNELLNCNKALPKTDLVRRVYSGTQNRLRSINGYKLIQQKCEAGATCIFSEKSASDYWIVENSVSDDNYKYTRITTNPTVEVLVEGPLNKAVLQSLAATYGNNDFLNPTEIIIGTEVTEISSDLFDGITTIRLTTLGVKTYLMNKCLVIRDNAFFNCPNLKSVTIPDSVISIEKNIFTVCGLTSIIIPASVTSIGASTFTGCTALTSVTFKKGINVNIDTPNDMWNGTPVEFKEAIFPTGGTATPSDGDVLSDFTNINLSAASGDVVFTA